MSEDHEIHVESVTYPDEGMIQLECDGCDWTTEPTWSPLLHELVTAADRHLAEVRTNG